MGKVVVRVQVPSQGTDVPPIRFQFERSDLLVEEVVDQWLGSDATYFKMRANDGNLYILSHKACADDWLLESVRHERR